MMRALLSLFVCMILASSPSVAQEPDLFDLYTPHQGLNSQDPDQPHRSTAELARHLADISVQLFAVSQANMKQDLLANQKFFNNQAFRRYLQFLQNSGYLPVMQELNLNMSGLSEVTPLLLQKGVDEETGVYRWVFSVPVTVILGGNLSVPDNRLPRPDQITLTMTLSKSSAASALEQVVITDIIHHDQNQANGLAVQ